MKMEQHVATTFNMREMLQKKATELQEQIDTGRAELQTLDKNSKEYQAKLAEILKMGGRLGDVQAELKRAEGEKRAAPSPDEIRAAREAGLIKRVGAALQKPTLEAAPEPKVILSGALQEDIARMNYDARPDAEKVQQMRAISDADIAAFNSRQ